MRDHNMSMPTLREVYENPSTSTRNPALLAKRSGTTLKSAQAFLRDQPAAQISRRVKPPNRKNFSPTGAAHGVWLIDTMYLREYAGVNSKRGAMFTAVNPNTRYTYARPSDRHWRRLGQKDSSRYGGYPEAERYRLRRWGAAHPKYPVRRCR